MAYNGYEMCRTGALSNWRAVFDCTEPNSWGYSGIYLCLGMSIIGAGM